MTEWFAKLLDYGLYILLYPLIMPKYIFNPSQLEDYNFYIYTKVIYI